MGRAGITNYFVNTIITALQAPEWETLLQRIGADAMLHLLTETHFFVSLPNDCLCQMTGEPVIHMVPRASHISEQTSTASLSRGDVQAGKRPFPFPDAHRGERQTKRLKVDASTPTHRQNTGMTVSKYVTLQFPSISSPLIRPARRSPADILLVRTRLFYARPRRLPHTTHIIVGLSDRRKA
ncbi:hypothetical protein L208DRAFT_1236556 [Tricholoma matsutake]|nr:hypothetical protein L208DRAFT_1236556 [Tricholoma matsutake 945]